MQLDELFGSAYTFEWTQRSTRGWSAVVELPDDDLLKIEFEFDEDLNAWGINFTRNGHWEATGSGDASRIFATVIRVIRDWNKQVHPKTIWFSAMGPSRQSLYDALIQRFTKDFGWKQITSGQEFFSLKGMMGLSEKPYLFKA